MKLTTYIIVGLLFNEFISFLSAIMLNVYNGKTQYGSNDSFEEWSRLTIAASILASIPMTKLIHMDCDMTLISLPSKRMILAVILFVSAALNFEAGSQMTKEYSQTSQTSISTYIFTLYSVNAFGKLILAGMIFKAGSNYVSEKLCFVALVLNEFVVFMGACSLRSYIGGGDHSVNLFLASSIFAGVGLANFLLGKPSHVPSILSAILSFAAGIKGAVDLDLYDIEGQDYYKAHQALLLMPLFGSRVVHMILWHENLKPSSYSNSAGTPAPSTNIEDSNKFNVSMTSHAGPSMEPNQYAAHIDAINMSQLPVAQAVPIMG